MDVNEQQSWEIEELAWVEYTKGQIDFTKLVESVGQDRAEMIDRQTMRYLLDECR